MLKLKVAKAFVFGVFKTKHEVSGLLWFLLPSWNASGLYSPPEHCSQ